MNQAEAAAAAQQGYDAMAEVYTNHVALEATVPSLSITALELFAHQAAQLGARPVADVGCGPGHITAHLAERGLDIIGVDVSSALLAIASASYPDLRFEQGELAALPFGDRSMQGVLSKHSLIHTPAALVPGVLAEFARVLVPGGLLYLSFFASDTPSDHGLDFDHAVCTAYQLDIEATAAMLGAASFIEEVRIVRKPREGERQLRHATFFARRAEN